VSPKDRITVVIACYDDGSTLEEAVGSAESEPRCEVIVVNDGSSDPHTVQVLKRLAARGIRVMHQENQGSASARMTGISASTTEYVLPLDADDFLISGGVGLLADFLDANPDVDVVWGRYRYVGERTHEKPVARELDPWLITYLDDIPMSALFRRGVLEGVGGWSFDDAYEDWDLWMTLAERRARGVGLSVPVYCHRLHGIRRNRRAKPREAEILADLRNRHPALFAKRAENRARSTAPVLLKLALPALERLRWPSLHRRRTASAIVLHVAHRRGGYHRPLLRLLARIGAHPRGRPLRTAVGNPP